METQTGTLLTSEYLDKKFGITHHYSWSSPYGSNAMHYDYGLPGNFTLSQHSGGFSLISTYPTETSSGEVDHFDITTVEEFEELYAFLLKFTK